MCWSAGASATVATVGIVATAYAIKQKKQKQLWIPLLYFSMMEALQAVTYFYIDQCDSPPNQILTLMAYLHIAFQGVFVNMLTMNFIPQEVKSKIQDWVYTICFICTILFLILLYPFDWAGQCKPGVDAMCGQILCSMQETWHMGWHVPMNNIPWIGPIGYMFPCMVLPFIYGAWRVGLYLLLAGPIVSYALTQNMNEWPAVWCILSVALILIAIGTPLQKYLNNENWYGIKYPWK